MNILKEIILNQLIKVPQVKKVAKKYHQTGLSNCPERVDVYYKTLLTHSSVKNKNILELGPGMTFDIVRRAREDGAARVAIVDIEPYLTEQQIAEHEIEYKVYDGGVIPFPDGSFDYIWSTSVYEHLRHPSLTVSETFRLLRPGGRVVHLIDLIDHFSYGTDDPTIVFNCLKYPAWLWNAMTWNRSNYVNRLRASDWVNLHESVGFKVIGSDLKTSEYVEKHYKNDSTLGYLTRYSDTDAVSTDIYLVAEK